MKTSVTLTFDSHVLQDVKKKFTGKNLSSFTNSLYTDWLEARKKEELIAAYKRTAGNKLYREMAELTEGITIENWNRIDEIEGKHSS